MLYRYASCIFTLIDIIYRNRCHCKRSVCVCRYTYQIIICDSLRCCSIRQSYIITSCNSIRIINPVTVIVKVIYSYSAWLLSLIKICYSLSSACKCTVCVCRHAAYLKVRITFRTCCIWQSQLSCTVKYVRCTKIAVVIYRLMINCHISGIASSVDISYSLRSWCKYTVCVKRCAHQCEVRYCFCCCIIRKSEFSDSWLNIRCWNNVTAVIYINCCYISCRLSSIFIYYSLRTCGKSTVLISRLGNQLIICDVLFICSIWKSEFSGSA